MNKLEYFLKIFLAAEKHYGRIDKRLAGEGWEDHWQTLVATILSAQSRDETTIPIAEALFRRYPTLKSLADAKEKDVFNVIRSINYNKTKAKHCVAAAKYMIEYFNGKVPKTMEELIEIPGVGRKTANLVITECHNMDGLTVDTHVHRISNVLGFVNTKTPNQTEIELKKLAPRKYWYRINRIFVLWGKEVRGRDKKKFLERINYA